MDISGKLIKKLEPITGTSANGTWKKQLFVIEYASGQFPKKACFQIWGDKVDISSLVEGEEIHVFFEPESREYNNNWYTDLRAWKVEAAQNQNGGFAPQMPTPPPPTGAPAPTEVPGFMDAGSKDDDDLPF